MQLNVRHAIKGGDTNVTRDQSHCKSISNWMLPGAPHLLFRSNVANCYVRKGVFREQGLSNIESEYLIRRSIMRFGQPLKSLRACAPMVD